MSPLEKRLNDCLIVWRDSPDARFDTAAHEAGHVHYAIKFGFTIHGFEGPHLDQSFPGVVGASVILDPPDMSGLTINEQIHRKALIDSAGEMFARHLSNIRTPPLGGYGDFSNFLASWTSVHGSSRTPIAERVLAALRYWKKAQKEVLNDLTDPAFCKAMRGLATWIEAQIPWGFERIVEKEAA